MAEGDSDLIKNVGDFLSKDNQRNTELKLRTKLVRSLEDQLVLRVRNYQGDGSLPPFTRIEKWSDSAFSITSKVLEPSLDGIGHKSVTLMRTPSGIPLIGRALQKHNIDASSMLSIGLHTDPSSETEALKTESGPPDSGKFSPGTGYIYDEESEKYFKIINVPTGSERSRPIIGATSGTDFVLDDVKVEDLGLMEDAFKALNGEMELAA